MKWAVFVEVFIAAALGSSAHAQLVVIADSRRLEARAEAEAASMDTDFPADVVHAGLGGEFNDSLTASALVSGASASATASQISRAEPSIITAQGGASASASSISGRAFCSSMTSAEIALSLADETTVVIISSRSNVGTGLAVVELVSLASGSPVFQGAGVLRTRLAPAEYAARFEASAFAERPAGVSGSASFSATIKLCLADLTADTFVNTNDFFAFLSLYQAADGRADFARDGAINTNDFFAFLAAYQLGC